MKLYIPLAVAVASIGYVTMHPGVAYAEPRLASSAPIAFTQKLSSYTIDPEHSSLYFEITHLGLTKVHGRINKFTGKVREDDKDLTKSSVELTAQMDSIDTAVAARDTHLKTADFFDVAKFPTLTFKSTKIERKGKGYILIGDLTIKDKTKSIRIPFTHHGPLSMKSMGDQPDRIGAIAEPITIKRSDFGIGSQFKLPDGTEGVSDTVTVRIAMEATLDK